MPNLPGSAASSRMTFSKPRGRKDGPRGPQEAPKTVQEPLSRRTLGPRRPRRPQDKPKRPPRRPKRAPRPFPRGRQEAKIIDFPWVLKVIGFLAFSPFRRSKTAPEAPKTTPRRPKRLPRAPQDCPRGPQDGPRGAQDGPRKPKHGPKRGPRRGPRTENPSLPLQEAPMRPQEAPKRPQETPKGSKKPKRGPKKSPKRLQNDPQEASKLSPRSPREAPGLISKTQARWRDGPQARIFLHSLPSRRQNAQKRRGPGGSATRARGRPRGWRTAGDPASDLPHSGSSPLQPLCSFLQQ